ncbi:MAG: helix-turn-helix domain-containing protein [Christensenellales bacterium]
MKESFFRENIKKNIREYRLMQKMTQGELAEKLGGKKSLVSNYENGYSVPDIFTLVELADIFDVSIDELIGRSDS